LGDFYLKNIAHPILWPKIEEFVDPLEHVTKFVFSKPNAVVETVLYRYPSYEKRTVICCSVMSGCPVGCRFCGTGDYFVRNLSADEITTQVYHALEYTGVEPSHIKKLQIMFMSMGEPMLNFAALKEAIIQINWDFPSADLLISTSGPSVDYDPLIQLSCDIDKVGLQFSVHETTDEKRNALIPFKKKLTLAQIAEVGNRWSARTGRNPFFNYCSHEENTSNEDAMRLYELFSPMVWNATVSVICERSDGMPTSSDYQKQLANEFSGKLIDQGYDVRVFDPAGQDTIGGGCGQLKYVQKWFSDNPEKARPSVGHGKQILHIPIKC
jgi:23S rRNA (adenine2503-C2)-methyltransferase